MADTRRGARASSSLFWSVVGSVVAFYVVAKLVFPFLSKWATGAPAPHPVPSALLLIYGLVFLLGVAVYVTSSDERLDDFVRPVREFLSDRRAGIPAVIRMGVLVAIPVAVGLTIWRAGAPGVASPTSIRIQHPTMPGKYEKLVNPFRPEPAGGGVVPEEVMREGVVLYETNCRPCHGVAAAGDGPMARFFRLAPANFRDPGYIATVVEPYAFWRVTEGGPGLPPVATPWDSAMPIWKDDLTEEERWKVLLAEYAIAEVEPRKPEKLE